MSIGAPLGARRSRAPADDTFPIAGQDRIFDIAFDATFIAAKPIGGNTRPPADDCLQRVLNYFFCSSFFGSAPDGGVVDDEDFASLDEDGVVALDDEDDGVDGEGCDDDAEDDDDGGVGDVD